MDRVDTMDIMDQTEKKHFLPTKSLRSIFLTNNKAAPGYPERPSVFVPNNSQRVVPKKV